MKIEKKTRFSKFPRSSPNALERGGGGGGGSPTKIISMP